MNIDNIDKIQAILVAVCASMNIFISSYFGEFTGLLYVVIFLMGADLITRIYTAGKRTDEKVESKKVINGFYNKLGMIMLIVLSLILDYSLVFITEMIGINIEGKILFTAFTLAWVFVREFISCLENLNHGGIKLPRFITDALNIIKDKIDQTAENLIPKGGQDEHKTM